MRPEWLWKHIHPVRANSLHNEMTMLPHACHCLRNTPFGELALLWQDQGQGERILRVVLSTAQTTAGRIVASSFPASVAGSWATVDLLADQMVSFLSGEDIAFSLEGLRLECCSGFQQQVLRVEHGIPRGRVSSYQRIAAQLGKPKAARAAGTALAANPFPILIPCHRAIRSDGSLGGYQGGLTMKRALLELEGVRFDSAGRVDPKEFYYCTPSEVIRT